MHIQQDMDAQKKKIELKQDIGLVTYPDMLQH